MAKEKRSVFQRRLFDDGISLINEETGETDDIISEKDAEKELGKKSNKRKVVKRNTKGNSEEI